MDETLTRHINKKNSGISFRFVLTLLCLAGATMSRSSLIVYDVAILSHEHMNHNHTVGLEVMPNNRGLLFCSYFFGYCPSSLVSGRLAELYSAKWTIAIASGVFIVIHLVTPYLLETVNIYAIVAGRVSEGLCLGVVNPALVVLLARWTPPDERFMACAVVYSGIHFGSAIGHFFTYCIMHYYDYKATFYIGGTLAFIWLMLHCIYVEDFPEYAKRNMKESERHYVMSTLDDVTYTPLEARRSKIPWRLIAKSPPVYALIMVHSTVHLVFNIGLARTTNPDRTKFKWKEDMYHATRAFLIASPFFWAGIVTILLSMFYTTVYRQKAISIADAIKTATTAGLLLPMVCMSVDFFASEDMELVAKPLIFITVAGVYVAIQVNHIELTPNYAGTLLGMTNGIGSITGIFIHAPPGGLLHNRRFIAALYGFTAMTSLIVIFIFNMFFSTEVQNWNFYTVIDKQHRLHASTRSELDEMIKKGDSEEKLKSASETEFE